MLTELTIHNLVLIESLTLSFTRGLSVLTGETGAGKSILLDGIGLALGARAESRMVRAGADKASISAHFSVETLPTLQALLHEQDIACDDELLVRRTLNKDGKSKAFINDTPVSIQLLKSVGAHLMEIHGQHDQRGLLDASTHLAVLDDYVADAALLQHVSTSYAAWKEAVKAHDILLKRIEAARAEAEYVEHAYNELSQLNPQHGEEEELAATRTAMQHQEQIIQTMQEALQALQEPTAVTSVLSQAERVLARLPDAAAALVAPATAALDRAHIELQEAVDQIELFAQQTGYDVQALEAAEERLFALRDMARKHRCHVDELAEKCAELQQKVEALASGEGNLLEAKQAIDTTRHAFLNHAQALSKKRHVAAAALQTSIQHELAGLKMGRATIAVELTEQPEADWHAGGIDRAQFVASTNPGSNMAPLHKIASGGELSRFMLACKMALSNQHGIASMIFDEIDTGVGGAVADKIGSRLRILAEAGYQVLCVTHLPQVAAHGHQHFMVQKDQQAEPTTTSVQPLNAVEREQEIARMLAGEGVTSEATAAAKKLLENAA